MNVFDLFARITLDSEDYERQLGKASDDTNSFADKLKSGLTTAGKVAGAGLAAATTAVAALGKASIEGYAEYEQLIGGVETLYGSEAMSIEEYAKSVGKSVDEVSHQYEMLMNRQDAVMENAQNAYKTAGMSANEYMNTVNGFAASLTSSLGEYEWQAAGYADMIVTDMADNANKMGTSLESIQNAYSGFAKQNYTMLDNLKLGYGGTKEEMERLLRDAEKFAGYIEGSLSIESFADVAEAINIVQTELGITGTTAAEASSTISGSVSSMKAAWSDLVTGLSDDNANLDRLIGNFVDSVATVGSNILPVVEKAISGIGTLVEKIAPTLGTAIPTIVTDVLPSMLNAGAQLFEGLISGIVSALPALISTAASAMGMLINGLVQQIPALASAAPKIISAFVAALSNLLPQLLQAGVSLLNELTTGIEKTIPDMIGRIPAIIEAFIDFVDDNLPTILEAGVNVLVALTDGIINSIPQLVSDLPKIISAFVDFFSRNFPIIVKTGVDILKNLITGIIKTIPELVASLPQIISAIDNGISSMASTIRNVGRDIIDWIIGGLSSTVSTIRDVGADIVGSIMDGISSAWSGLVSWFTGLWDDLFGNLEANVKVNQSTTSDGVDGSHASGLTYVPFDGYIAELHKGERVLTVDEAREYTRGVNIVQYIYSEAKTAADLMEEALYMQERAVYMGV